MTENYKNTRHWYFGSFVLKEDERQLERDGQPVRLGSRAFGLLLELVKRAGEYVSKDELLAGVWSDVVVDESSVRVHMSILRKTLGKPSIGESNQEWIANVPLRGYSFVGRVRLEHSRLAHPLRVPPTPLVETLAELPTRLSRLVGREAEVARVLGLLTFGRLVTVTGAGGMGKTSVAIRVGETHRNESSSRVWFVDLAPLTGQGQVLSSLARAVGVRGGETDVENAVIQRLAEEETLLLVDNCEHVIDSLAPLAVRLLSTLPRLRILLTSREALNVDGEHVFRIMPLAVPSEASPTLEEAMQSPAVQLLVERAKAAGAYVFDESSGAALVKICQQVDGIPLAIELVAARLGSLSASELTLRLDDHMRLHSTIKRAALPRQRTLAAALDWSVRLLSDAELMLFRRLSIFRSRFDAESALGVAIGDLDIEVASDALISLARKSLVVYEADQGVHAPYRLLDTTRSYAGLLLDRSGERAVVSGRHAHLMLDLARSAGTDLALLDARNWTLRYGFLLDDICSALNWSVNQGNDTGITGELTVASAPLWFRLSEVTDYRNRVQAALNYVNSLRTPDRLTAGMLHIALYNALWHTGGTIAQMIEACEFALSAALEFKVGSLEFQARWGLCALNVTRGDYSPAMRHAQILSNFASQCEDDVTRNLSNRMLALSSHFCGEFSDARMYAEAAMKVETAARRSHANTFQPDARTTAMAILARTLWLQGDTQLALNTAKQCRNEIESLGHAMSSCLALFWLCPVAIWSGEQSTARAWVDTMLNVTSTKGLGYWHEWAACYDDALKLEESNDRESHIQMVLEKIAVMDEPRAEMMATFAHEWVSDGLVARVKRGEGQWNAAEIFRAAGVRQQLRGNATAAEKLYARALKLAHSQGALAWELRAARSMCELLQVQGKSAIASKLLEDVYQRSPAVSGGGHLKAIEENLAQTE